MDKSCHSSGESTTTSCSNSNSNIGSSTTRDEYLRHLNKISHRISKPIIRRNPTPHHLLDPANLLLHRPPPAPPQPPPPPPPPPLQLQDHLPPPQHQPPVYNINKSDFRDVVQKLTGSPAHERFSTPPPIHPPKPQSSRLQRIRPPPLSAVGNRPPPPPFNAPSAGAAINPNIPRSAAAAASSAPPPPPLSGNHFNAHSYRQVTPLSPLPPFPSVHGAVESPISAYMRYLQGSISADSDPKLLSRHSPLISPRWNNPAPPSQQQIPPPFPLPLPPSSSSMFSSQFPMMPTSPLPFGCMPSPRSPYPLQIGRAHV